MFITSVLLLLSLFSSKAASKLGIPALVLFLVVGMIAGVDGPGGIYFDDPWLAQSCGIIALAFIIFAGGLHTDWNEMVPIVKSGIILSTLGVLVTAGMVGLFTHYVFGTTLLQGLLLGAIVSSTDAAAVFSVLSAKSVGFKGNLKPLLEFESGSNDPIAVILTIGIVQLITTPNYTFIDLLPLLAKQIIIGIALGYGMGKLMVFILNKSNLENDGLYPVLSISLVTFTYSLTATLGGSGFLAVYLAGLLAGKSKFAHKNNLKDFHNGLAWLMQIGMFLILGLLVFPSRMIPVIDDGLLISAFLIFAARPVSVFLCLPFSKMNFREKLMTSWVGLRGAVPIILATFPLIAGVPHADRMFNIVFFIVLTSVLLQGTTIPLIAKWLKVSTSTARK